jgi:hypothetical protein
MKGYYIGKCECCSAIVAATCIYADDLETVAVDVADMIAGGLVVSRLGPNAVVRVEGHRDNCQET